MAQTTIIERPSGEGGESAVGWVVAAIVLVALVVGFVALFRHGTTVVPNIPNTGAPATVPGAATGGTGGNTSGASSGAGSGQSSY